MLELDSFQLQLLSLTSTIFNVGSHYKTLYHTLLSRDLNHSPSSGQKENRKHIGDLCLH